MSNNTMRNIERLHNAWNTLLCDFTTSDMKFIMNNSNDRLFAITASYELSNLNDYVKYMNEFNEIIAEYTAEQEIRETVNTCLKENTISGEQSESLKSYESYMTTLVHKLQCLCKRVSNNPSLKSNLVRCANQQSSYLTFSKQEALDEYNKLVAFRKETLAKRIMFVGSRVYPFIQHDFLVMWKYRIANMSQEVYDLLRECESKLHYATALYNEIKCVDIVELRERIENEETLHITQIEIIGLYNKFLSLKRLYTELEKVDDVFGDFPEQFTEGAFAYLVAMSESKNMFEEGKAKLLKLGEQLKAKGE